MASSSTAKMTSIKPRVILHGGAGNWSYKNLPFELYAQYRTSLLSILSSTYSLLTSDLSTTALDAAVHAVSLLENDPLFNAGHGAVFTRSGTNELESSIMVTNGHRKKGVGCMMLQHVKNPIKLAREMLLRGDDEDGKGGGAFGHQQLSGEILECLAQEWGLEMVDQEYFWTKRRWEEHQRGLGEGTVPPTEDEMLPQGTVGAVVLDASGTICVATSTGGLTNKLSGRIGDTPTLGAGFWADEFTVDSSILQSERQMSYMPQAISLSPLDRLSRGDVASFLADCLPKQMVSSYSALHEKKPASSTHRGHAISGTGNGDSFLRLSACRTASAISQFQGRSLQSAVTAVAGPNGMLQKSAGGRWNTGTFEGEGGMIGIELIGDRGEVIADFNCGGMFRAWVDENGGMQCRVFRKDYETHDYEEKGSLKV